MTNSCQNSELSFHHYYEGELWSLHRFMNLNDFSENLFDDNHKISCASNFNLRLIHHIHERLYWHLASFLKYIRNKLIKYIFCQESLSTHLFKRFKISCNFTLKSISLDALLNHLPEKTKSNNYYCLRRCYTVIKLFLDSGLSQPQLAPIYTQPYQIFSNYCTKWLILSDSLATRLDLLQYMLLIIFLNSVRFKDWTWIGKNLLINYALMIFWKSIVCHVSSSLSLIFRPFFQY